MGLKVDTDEGDVLKVAMESMIKEEVYIAIKVKSAYKIGEERCIIEK